MIRKLKIKLLFIVLAIMVIAISCEKDQIVEESSYNHIDDGNGMFKTVQVNELPHLKQELNHLTERISAKSGSSSSGVLGFQFFGDYDVKVATVGSTTTYTLPIVQERENNRQFSNLVLTYTDDLLTDSFILRYEGTEEYFDQLKIQQDVPFSGDVTLQSVNSGPDLFAKTLVCVETYVTYCRWTEDGKNDVYHEAGPNCKNLGLMTTVLATVCTNDPLTLDDGLPKPGGGANQDGSDSSSNSGEDNPTNEPDVGLGTGIPVSGNNTGPMPNPTCESDPHSFSDGSGSCYNAGDDLPDPIEYHGNDIFIGSANNTPGGDPYVPNDDDVFVLPDIPITMSKQVGATCVSSTIEYVANALGGDTNQNEIDNWFLNTFKIIIALEGVPYDKVSILVSQFLTTGPFIGVKEAIDAGNPYITNIELSRTVGADGSIAIDGHMVTIVGYHPNGDYIFMDPLAGTLREAPPSSFPNDYSYGGTITGVK
ncbi:hypothetical protein AAU57_03065 [Nonlabens sp. YIK11]|uniref:C39 family peptidase n=1 Tax=Nonlabens sp. YIK11 TaxID=1453349 RepID=UPI0006DC1B6D|nr:C39 family peptidase [Nonlabens sp. YIK11]KQC32420.1 hypothetical protein AAU57_03065 [Nonlabens sp. YIK11]